MDAIFNRAVKGAALPEIFGPCWVDLEFHGRQIVELPDLSPGVGILVRHFCPWQFAEIRSVGVPTAFGHPPPKERMSLKVCDERIPIGRLNEPTIDVSPEMATAPGLPLLVLWDFVVPMVMGMQDHPASSFLILLSNT